MNEARLYELERERDRLVQDLSKESGMRKRLAEVQVQIENVRASMTGKSPPSEGRVKEESLTGRSDFDFPAPVLGVMASHIAGPVVALLLSETSEDEELKHAVNRISQAASRYASVTVRQIVRELKMKEKSDANEKDKAEGGKEG